MTRRWRYLDLTREQGLAYMRTAPWSARRNFRGWYLPYELEQYNWASAPARRCCGRGWTPLRARGPGQQRPRAQHLDIFQPPGRQRHLEQLCAASWTMRACIP